MDIIKKRITLAGVIIFLLFAILISRNYYLQITQYEIYRNQAFGNSLKSSPIVPVRGKIFDRNGVLLADNKLAYKLTITPENTKNLNQSLQFLLQQKFITKKDITLYYKNRKKYKKFNSITLKEYLTEQEVAKFLVYNNLSGLELKPFFYRIYPQNLANSHIIGYVAKMNVKDKNTYDNNNYKGTEFVGKIGIEKQYEAELHGEVGVKQIEKNSFGRVINEIPIKDSKKGKDIYLTIDNRLQQKAAKLLKNKRASVVMMDVNSGEILLMLSNPGFDNSLFTTGISRNNYNKLIKDKNLPLFNRSIKGTYPPGSTIKPMIALGGLEQSTIHKHSKVYCPGHYKLPNYSRVYNDWNRNGHGIVEVTDAIAQSCDVFFYDLARKEGIDNLSSNLKYFGIGQKTGIDLPGEVAGTLPSKEWKKNNKKEPWYKGETLITGIGQGFITTTPLQLVVATAMIANFGKKLTPKLVIDTNKKLSNNNFNIQMPIKDIKNWELVIKGMKKTIYDSKGTARRLNKGLKYTLAGKTGTAQVFGLDANEKYIAEKYAENLRDHALFVGFAPIKNPQVAISIIIENAGSGSSKAAPVAKKILDEYFISK